MLIGLRAQGIAPILVLFHDGELAAQAREQGVEPIILPHANRSLWATSRRLARLLKQQQVRVVHVHGYKATVFCALARSWYPFSVVKTEHGLPEPMRGKPLQVLRDRCYHLLDRIATRFSKATVCYVTEELRAHHARAHAGLSVTVIPNGVANMEREQFKRPKEFHPEWFNVAIVGRLDTVKGHNIAIEALCAPIMPLHVHLQIVGAGPMESALHALAQVRGVANRVHLLGFRRNVYDYLAHCDVLLIPSLHEGLPYTLLEAMALGLPIVASNVGGLAEVLDEGTTGLLARPGDPLSIANAIVRLQVHPEHRRQLGENAQRVQRSAYSLEAMSTRYQDVYQRETRRARF